MRLINARTGNLEQFVDSKAPKYAILSHTWGELEVNLKELENIISSGNNLLQLNEKKYEKIQLTCRQAIQDEINYVWVDTCCIDKSSSAELSEAINSMFDWYRRSAICYVYLEDVTDIGDTKQFLACRWFTRGWTLQELIAPNSVVFFSASWNAIGTKATMDRLISEASRIEIIYLQADNISQASVAQKLSWAAKRQTTRLEDEAYCLLGLLDVNMPLLYGEGKKAFRRLQEEIIKNSEDQTLFAWGLKPDKSSGMSKEPSNRGYRGFVAESTEDFLYSGRVVRNSVWQTQEPYSMTNKGLQISLYVLDMPRDYSILKNGKRNGNITALIGCQNLRNPYSVLAIILASVSVEVGDHAEKIEYVRDEKFWPMEIEYGNTAPPNVSSWSLYIKNEVDRHRRNVIRFRGFNVDTDLGSLKQLSILEVYPSGQWNPDIKQVTGPNLAQLEDVQEWCAVVRLRYQNHGQLAWGRSRNSSEPREAHLTLFLFRNEALNEERVELATVPSYQELGRFYWTYLNLPQHVRLERVYIDSATLSASIKTEGRMGERFAYVDLSLLGKSQRSDKAPPQVADIRGIASVRVGEGL